MTTYGWQIDHTVPSARGGSNEPDNLEPLHWAANIAKGASLI